MYVIFDTQLKSRSIIYRLVCPYLIRTDKKEIFICGYTMDTLQPIIMISKKGSIKNVVIGIAFFFFYDEKKYQMNIYNRNVFH